MLEFKRQNLYHMIIAWMQETDPDRFKAMVAGISEAASNIDGSTGSMLTLYTAMNLTRDDEEKAVTCYLNSVPGTWRLISMNERSTGRGLSGPALPTEREYEFVWSHE
jgi:hypothetical protein